VPAVLRVTVMVPWPEEGVAGDGDGSLAGRNGQSTQGLDRAGGIVEAVEVERATGQGDGWPVSVRAEAVGGVSVGHVVINI